MKLWDSRLGEPVLSVDHGDPVQAALMLPGGGVLLTAGGNVMKVWDVLAGGRLLQVRGVGVASRACTYIVVVRLLCVTAHRPLARAVALASLFTDARAPARAFSLSFFLSFTHALNIHTQTHTQHNTTRTHEAVRDRRRYVTTASPSPVWLWTPSADACCQGALTTSSKSTTSRSELPSSSTPTASRTPRSCCSRTPEPRRG